MDLHADEEILKCKKQQLLDDTPEVRDSRRKQNDKYVFQVQKLQIEDKQLLQEKLRQEEIEKAKALLKCEMEQVSNEHTREREVNMKYMRDLLEQIKSNAKRRKNCIEEKHQTIVSDTKVLLNNNDDPIAIAERKRALLREQIDLIEERQRRRRQLNEWLREEEEEIERVAKSKEIVDDSMV